MFEEGDREVEIDLMKTFQQAWNKTPSQQTSRAPSCNTRESVSRVAQPSTFTRTQPPHTQTKVPMPTPLPPPPVVETQPSFMEPAAPQPPSPSKTSSSPAPQTPNQQQVFQSPISAAPRYSIHSHTHHPSVNSRAEEDELSIASVDSILTQQLSSVQVGGVSLLSPQTHRIKDVPSPTTPIQQSLFPSSPAPQTATPQLSAFPTQYEKLEVPSEQNVDEGQECDAETWLSRATDSSAVHMARTVEVNFAPASPLPSRVGSTVYRLFDRSHSGDSMDASEIVNALKSRPDIAESLGFPSTTAWDIVETYLRLNNASQLTLITFIDILPSLLSLTDDSSQTYASAPVPSTFQSTSPKPQVRRRHSEWMPSPTRSSLLRQSQAQGGESSMSFDPD